MLKNIISLATIVLCLGLIGCTETNGPIYSEPIVINDTPTGGETGLYISPKISPVLIKSDIILVGEVYEVVITNPDKENYVSAYLNITEVLKGSTNAKEVQVNSNRFSKNDKCILFLQKDGDSYVLTTEEFDYYNESIIWFYHQGANFPYRKDDIKLLLNAYNNNKELFSKVGKQDLFNLWSQLRSDEIIKCSFLMDIYDIVDKQDIPMLLEWKRIETNIHVINQIEGIIQMLEGRGEKYV